MSPLLPPVPPWPWLSPIFRSKFKLVLNQESVSRTCRAANTLLSVGVEGGCGVVTISRDRIDAKRGPAHITYEPFFIQPATTIPPS